MKNIILFGCFTCLLSPVMAQTSNTDSSQVHSIVSGFYKWYGKNSVKANSFKLYNTSAKKPPFKINWKEVDRYLAWLKANAPQLGTGFATNERQFFKQCDSAFVTQQKDEVPYGFDSDRFTNSQEPDYTIEAINKAKQWVIKTNDLTATVEIWGTYSDKGKEVETLVICLDMKKEKGKWTIARIGCTFAVPEQKNS